MVSSSGNNIMRLSFRARLRKKCTLRLFLSTNLHRSVTASFWTLADMPTLSGLILEKFDQTS